MIELQITSPVFKNNTPIPKKYTCDGDDINPPLKLEGLPDETKSIVLIVDDPDAPMGTWDHWIVWNIPPMEEIAENVVPGVEGMNDFQRQSYGGTPPNIVPVNSTGALKNPSYGPPALARIKWVSGNLICTFLNA